MLADNVYATINGQTLLLKDLIDINGLNTFNLGIRKVIQNKMNDAVNSGLKIAPYSSTLDFPAVGDNKTIYIVTTSKEIWLWDSRLFKYYCFGADYHAIKVINGGSSVSE